MVNEKVKFRLRGPFSVSTFDGVDLTPRSKKSIAILAMLAEPERNLRSRRWLEDKLWSDRGPAQAQGSLRSALTEIRQSLGAYKHIFHASRNSVWLDTNLISTDLRTSDSTREFMEGIDIVDAEFNHWLVEMRLKYGSEGLSRVTSDARERIMRIRCETPLVSKSEFESFSRIVGQRIGSTVSNFIAHSRCVLSDEDLDLQVQCSVENTGGGTVVLTRVIDTKRDEVLHADHFLCGSLHELVERPTLLGQFCWNVADVALERLHYAKRNASAIARRASVSQEAIINILSFEAERMHRSLQDLDAAIREMDSGLYFGLKAWAKTTMVLENVVPEDDIVLEEIREYLSFANEIAPENPMVMALTAGSNATLLSNYSSAYDMARRALRQNPNNLFALQAVSVSQSVQGNLKDAYANSLLALSISQPSKYEARCHLHHALLCLQLGKTDEAERHAKAATFCNPIYRAPKRQLIALAGLKGDVQACKRFVADLSKVEPGFSLDRYVRDDGYHTHTLRKSGYLSRALPFLSELDC